MLAAVAGELTLEIIEGPGSGKTLALTGPVVIGRAEDADLVLEDGEASRHHVRITPHPDGSATVEDLESANGTFINQNELVGPGRVDPGDELLLGVTVLQVRSQEDLRSRGSAVIQLPPSLATTPRAPTYVNPEVVRADTAQQQPAAASHPTVERYLDTKVRRRAQLAPLALLVLIAIVLIIVFAVK